MDVILRPCDADGLQQLHDVAMQSYRAHYRYLWTSEDRARWYMDRSFSLGSLKRQMEDAACSFYMVHHAGQACGFIKINWAHHLHNDPGSMELERIYLLKEHAGRGIGSAVMQQVAQMAEEKGRTLIWLKSMDSSPSIRFYQHCGFRKTGTETLTFEGLHDRFRNMWIMELKLR